MSVTTLIGDCREVLATLPEQSVQTVVTSPPYFGLRSYGVGTENGEIGLEPSPAAYVAALVAVFREVRRVLRDDGTVWLNLGDSYAMDSKWGGASGGKNYTSAAGELPRERKRVGLADKQLIGIPWRVALALQQPYYAGKIAQEIDRVWLAAMIEAEGCFAIHRRLAGSEQYRKSDTYGALLQVSNTHLGIVERCKQIAGGRGSIHRQDRARNQPIYRWQVASREARDIAQEIYPHLVAKQQQCRIMFGSPSSGDGAAAAHEALKALHRGGDTPVDFPAPPSLHEPGWYLRSDCIWAKPNCMPESVTDRPTRSHEYVFLLAKREAYYYDAAAVADPAKNAGRVITLGEKSFSRGQAAGAGVKPSGNGTVDAYTVTSTRNRRTVWTIPTATYRGAHFATFPEALVEPCVRAGSRPGDTVLDPFSGSGTTGRVAERLGRDAILIELNPAYGRLQDERLNGVQVEIPL